MILKQSVPLKKYSNYKIGGIADYFYEFKSTQDLVNALTEYKKIDPQLKNVFILGKGTNVLFMDDGFRGLVLKNSINFIKREGEVINAGSGVLIEELNSYS